MTLRDALRSYTESIKAHTGLHYVPSFNDMNTSSNDDLEETVLHGDDMSMPQDQGPGRTNITGSRMSNKQDEAWPAFETADIHRVNVTDHTRNKSQLYDTGRHPSVWEYIIKSDNLKSSDFKSLDANRDGKITASDLTSSLHVTHKDAKNMIREADRNKDKVVDVQEYEEILSHYGSE